MRREREIATLTRLLRETDAPGLKIAAVVGPGGVGKSHVLEAAFRAEDLRTLGYVHLSVDASNPQTRADFFGLLDGLAPSSLPEPARPNSDYFRQFRKVEATYRRLAEDASAELERSKVPEELRTAVAALVRTGLFLNQCIPITRTKLLDIAAAGLDDEKAVEALDTAWEMTANLAALRHGALVPASVRTRRARVRSDLYNVTAEALRHDLATLLAGNRRRDTRKNADPLGGFSRLLIVLDDFEAIEPVLGEFILSALLPCLAQAPYPSLVLIASRDDLEAIHPSFGQHVKRWIVEEMRLASFDRQETFEILEECGIPADRRESIFASTQGFPYLVSLRIAEAQASDTEAALFAKKYFDRTTRWMTERERSWFRALCYLEAVNEDTIPCVIEGDSPEEVQRWFEHEASIRDPYAPVFTVRPLIREKVLRYLATRSPSEHKRMVERARSSNEAHHDEVR